jgi:hypothetical protein
MANISSSLLVRNSATFVFRTSRANEHHFCAVSDRFLPEEFLPSHWAVAHQQQQQQHPDLSDGTKLEANAEKHVVAN